MLRGGKVIAGYFRQFDFRQSVSTIRRRSLLWGYAAIMAIAALSTIGNFVYQEIFDLPSRGRPSYPFVIFSVAIFVAICLLRPLLLVIRKHPEPLRQLRRDVVDYRWWLLTSAIMALAIPQTLEFASTMKKAIPQFVPFYADGTIIGIEAAILGTDAWRLTHAVIGEAATRAIDLIYGLWHLSNIALLCWLVLTTDRRFQVRAVITYQLTWVLLGGVLATALSSVGPCFLAEFTGSQRFAPLMEHLGALDARQGLHTLTARGYLLASEGTDSFGAGISAMPSLHVAVAFLTLLTVIVRTKSLVFRFAAFAYLSVIFVGSIHLGWHYALDGVIAIIGVLAIWWASGKFLVWIEGGVPDGPAATDPAPWPQQGIERLG